MMSIWLRCNSLIVFFLLVFFSSCNHEEDGYKLLEEGVQFKFQTLGEDGFAPAIGQYISFQVSIYDDQQKLIYTTDKKGVDKHEHFLYTHNKQGAIQRGLLQFEEGDSVSFVMNQAKFKEQFPKINVSPKNSSFRVELLFTFIEDKNERDNRIGALLNQAMLKEEVLISEYFETSGDRERKIKAMEKSVIQEGYTQIFMDTPFRNNKLIEEVIRTCNKDLRLSVSSELTGPNEKVLCYTIAEWKKIKYDYKKVPVMICLGK